MRLQLPAHSLTLPLRDRLLFFSHPRKSNEPRSFPISIQIKKTTFASKRAVAKCGAHQHPAWSIGACLPSTDIGQPLVSVQSRGVAPTAMFPKHKQQEQRSGASRHILIRNCDRWRRGKTNKTQSATFSSTILSNEYVYSV